VHLLDPETINISTECKRETMIHLPYGMFILLLINPKDNQYNKLNKCIIYNA